MMHDARRYTAIYKVECLPTRSVKGLPTNRGVCDDADTAIYNLAEC